MHENHNNFPNLGGLVEDHPDSQDLWSAPNILEPPIGFEEGDRIVDVPEAVPPEPSEEEEKEQQTNETSSMVAYLDSALPSSPVPDSLQNNGKTLISAALFEDSAGREVQQLPDGTYLKFRSWKEWAKRLRHEGSIDAQAELTHSKELHEELAGYGIALAPTTAQASQSPSGEPGYFMRSAPIEGAPILDVATAIPVEKLEGLYVSLANYYLDKIENGGQYLNDLGSNSQFIYGHMPGSDINKIYLVDQEPAFLDAKGYPPISAAVKQLQFMIEIAEKRADTKMPYARQATSKALTYAYY